MTMRPTLYQASRMLTTAGVSAVISFDPTKITNRLRKSIQRQVASGVITGGYSSHAARIAKYLCKQFNLKYSDNSWYGVRIPSMEAKHHEKFIEVIHADLAAFLLDADDRDPQWHKNNAAGAIKKIRSCVDTDVRTHSVMFQKQLQALIVSTRTREEFQKANQVAAMLDAINPIIINQFNIED
jgi:hypothetical protein